ncbi:MAG: TlpA family protein disulfide reductase [Saprospiraceae bacterium]|nr:TlpA family protein disulfide reductase [Saprospiraceae bacterium]
MKISTVSLLLALSSFLPHFAKAQSSPPIYETFDELAPIFAYSSDTTYVINFWATWCKPCVEELPFIEAIRDKYAGEKVKVILVSLDFPKQIETKLIPFMEERQLRSEVVVLTDGRYNDWIDRVDTRWDGAIPVTLVYKGDQRYFAKEAFHSFEELDDILSAFIK